MWKIYAASETCLQITEADKVLRYLVMFLPVLLHWIYKMKYNRYQHSLAFKNRPLLVSLIYFSKLE